MKNLLPTFDEVSWALRCHSDFTFVHLYISIYISAKGDHFTPAALRARGNESSSPVTCMIQVPPVEAPRLTMLVSVGKSRFELSSLKKKGLSVRASMESSTLSLCSAVQVRSGVWILHQNRLLRASVRNMYWRN